MTWLARYPFANSSSDSLRVDFEVQRSRHSGSPRLSGSTRSSRASSRPGWASMTREREAQPVEGLDPGVDLCDRLLQRRAAHGGRLGHCHDATPPEDTRSRSGQHPALALVEMWHHRRQHRRQPLVGDNELAHLTTLPHWNSCRASYSRTSPYQTRRDPMLPGRHDKASLGPLSTEDCPAQPRQRQPGRSPRVLVTIASAPSTAMIHQAPPNNEPTTRSTSPAPIRTAPPALVAMSRVNAIPTSFVSPHGSLAIP